jgi:hypothetical protein
MDFTLPEDPYGIGTVGPQSDGTNFQSFAAYPPSPTDAGGGPPADYSATVLDIFRTGINAYTASANQQAVIDYKKFEATNGGLYQQGRNAYLPGAANGKLSGTTLLIIGALVVFALMEH